MEFLLCSILLVLPGAPVVVALPYSWENIALVALVNLQLHYNNYLS